MERNWLAGWLAGATRVQEKRKRDEEVQSSAVILELPVAVLRSMTGRPLYRRSSIYMVIYIVVVYIVVVESFTRRQIASQTTGVYSMTLLHNT